MPDSSSPSAAHAPQREDAFLFSGNRHESVPRALFLDRRLTPLERNAWQVFRLRLNADGLTAFPSYDELRPYLASMPCGPLASSETIARALTVLRLTRWLSLVRRRRDPRTGRIVGNLYVLHDEPLTPFEAMQLDAEYLGLVGRALTHVSKAIQCIGTQVVREIGEDPMLRGRVLPTRIQVLAQRLNERGLDGAEPTHHHEGGRHDSPDSPYPQEQTVRDSEQGKSTPVRNRCSPSSESESGRKPTPDKALRNPKPDSTSTVLSSVSHEVRTVRRALAHAEKRPERSGLPDQSVTLRLPPRFTTLKVQQQSGALVALRQVDEGLRQSVLDEWDARCAASTVRNPAGYLFGLIQRAIHGEFKRWAADGTDSGQERAGRSPSDPATPAPTSAPPSEATTSASSEVARAHLARLRQMLRPK